MMAASSGSEARAAKHGLSRFGDTAMEEQLRPVQDEKGEDKQEEDDEKEDELEEAVKVRVRRAPGEPTKKEREEHEATHIPYRDWCAHCVRGRATNRPHRADKEKEDEEDKQHKVPRISMDYFFMGQQGERAHEYPMILMVDEHTDTRYIRAVGKKGLGEGKEMELIKFKL